MPINGTNGKDNLPGTGGDDDIFGFADDDILTGLGGDDWLNGGTGADTMIGGIGDDTYVVDNAGDVVTENAGEGTDKRVLSWISYTLGANVENLSLSGTASINGTGNELRQLHQRQLEQQPPDRWWR